jgi:hypothetical protein
VLIADISALAALMAHGSEPRPTAIIVVSCLALVFGVGTTLTGLVLTIMKERGTGSRGEAGGIFGGLDA